jgi:hypothetical protein
LTRATLSSQCIHAVSHDDISCNLCGLIFYKLWTLFYPGNMFAASCEYVNRLLPPAIFEARMIDSVKSSLVARLHEQLQSNIFKGAVFNVSDSGQDRVNLDGLDRLEYWGVDRFSVDHWIASHPTVDPCDVSGSSSVDMDYWQHKSAAWSINENTTSADRPYGPATYAPTLSTSPFYYNQSLFDSVMTDFLSRIREASFLSGHLLRWHSLYGRYPTPDSRIWSWFPDDKLWKNASAIYGANVVSNVVGRYHVAF